MQQRDDMLCAVVGNNLLENTFPMAIADEVAGLDDTPETPLAPPPAMPTALSTAISVRTKEER